MKQYKFIPYDKDLVSRARELRKSETEAENIFWKKILKNGEFASIKFTRQKPIGSFIVDFYCASLALAVEIDGGIHRSQMERDAERDNYLRHKFGICVIRYGNDAVRNNPGKIIKDLREKIQSKSPDKGI